MGKQAVATGKAVAAAEAVVGLGRARELRHVVQRGVEAAAADVALGGRLGRAGKQAMPDVLVGLMYAD